MTNIAAVRNNRSYNPLLDEWKNEDNEFINSILTAVKTKLGGNRSNKESVVVRARNTATLQESEISDIIDKIDHAPKNDKSPDAIYFAFKNGYTFIVGLPKFKNEEDLIDYIAMYISTITICSLNTFKNILESSVMNKTDIDNLGPVFNGSPHNFIWGNHMLESVSILLCIPEVMERTNNTTIHGSARLTMDGNFSDNFGFSTAMNLSIFELSDDEDNIQVDSNDEFKEIYGEYISKIFTSIRAKINIHSQMLFSCMKLIPSISEFEYFIKNRGIKSDYKYYFTFISLMMTELSGVMVEQVKSNKQIFFDQYIDYIIGFFIKCISELGKVSGFKLDSEAEKVAKSEHEIEYAGRFEDSQKTVAYQALFKVERVDFERYKYYSTCEACDSTAILTYFMKLAGIKNLDSDKCKELLKSINDVKI